MRPEHVVSLVAEFFGIKSSKGLATSVGPDLRRGTVIESARWIACLMLQIHCASSDEAVAAALKKRQINWTGGYIRLSAAAARRKLAEDVAFRLCFENVQRIYVVTSMMKGLGLNKKWK